MNPSTPPPAPGEPPKPKKPLVIVPRINVRDLVITVGIALLLLGFIVYSVMKMGSDRSPNLITGTVKSHYETGQRETLLTVSPTKGVKSKTANTGFYLKVESGGRTYDVMVSKQDWERYKDGNSIEFLRPEDEQQGVGR